MGWLAWIILGLIAGAIARAIVPSGPGGCIGDIIVGVVGAFIGGFIYSLFGHTGITGFNLWSIICAIIGSIVLLLIVRLLSGATRPPA